MQRLKPMQRLQPLQNAQFGSQLKMPKTWEKVIEKNITVVFCKKPLEKTPNIREMRQLLKSTPMQRL